MKFAVVAFLLFLALTNFASAKVFTKCELAEKLHYSGGISKSLLPDWLCLVESESDYDSSVIGPVNTDDSYDWGIFQINDRYWCSVGIAGKACNANCKGKLRLIIFWKIIIFW